VAVTAAIFAVALFAGHQVLIDLFAGHTQRRAHQGPEALSPEARTFVERCMQGLDPTRMVDYHVHLGGVGEGSDCWVNPRMRSLRHPTSWARLRGYLSAAGLSPEDPDPVFVDNLAQLAGAWPPRGRFLILAFDYRYRDDGTLDLERSEFHVPNEYAFAQVARYPELFVAAASIHPYRPDAVEQLERWAARGATVVKWLPNAQGIDPASPACDDFYAAAARLGVALLVHTGEEHAVEAQEDQALGNPLRLRRPLEAGVRVIAAHCASSGSDLDLDDPEEGRLPSFELLLRLLEEPRWEGLLFADISTVTQVNRYPRALATLLERVDLHPRLVNGSDYPLPAVNVLYQTRALRRDGFLTAEERELLNELYHYDPLLFDLCLKRSVRSPTSGVHFADSVFHEKVELPLRRSN